MKVFRDHVIISRLMAFFTGLVFLNMSFFLAEIRILGISLRDKVLAENIVKLLSGAGAEEERDAGADAKTDTAGSEVDILSDNQSIGQPAGGVQSKLFAFIHGQLNLRSGFYKKSTPPPEA